MATAGPARSRSRMRWSPANGLLTSQSLTRSSDGSPVTRCGASSHGVNEAPTACAWSRSVGSASTRTSCPRSTSRRATPSSGGTAPPPSQVANRYRLMSPLLPGRRLVEDAAHQPEDGGDRRRARLLQVAPQQLPDRDVGGGVEGERERLRLPRR